MLTNIRAWGNSQGLYIPKSILNEVGLAVNDEVELSVENGRIYIAQNNDLKKKADAFENLQRLRGQMQVDGALDYREEYYKYLDERYQVK